MKLVILLLGLLISTTGMANTKIDCAEKTCRVYFGYRITHPNDYVQFIHLLEIAPKDMTIYIYSEGHGGNAFSSYRLASAITRSKAKTIAVITGRSVSGHAIIAIAADEMEIHPGAYFMFHRGSQYKSWQKMCNDMADEKDRGHNAIDKCIEFNEFLEKEEEKFIRLIYKKRLTKTEIDAIVLGKDIYISGDVLKARVKKETK